MGLSWQQGPLAPGAVGRFLTDRPLPERLLFAEPARRRLRVRLGGAWVADSEEVILLHEPGHYPVAYFPIEHISDGVLTPVDRTTTHRDLGATRWFTVAGPARRADRAASWATHCSAGSSKASTPPLAWRSPSPSARDLSPPPRSATPPPLRPAHPASHHPRAQHAAVGRSAPTERTPHDDISQR